ncbi:MAG: hypothetical protein QY323_04610 [Patescibacteria group bacterium]|nr:MAG: hypothetical protein QY323_04610 [Patescibacteria group bacterium]
MHDQTEYGPSIEIIIEIAPHDLRGIDGAFLIDEEELENAEEFIRTFNEAS